MALIRLEIPTLVKDYTVDKHSNYYLRPLFWGYPTALNRRLDLATAQLKKEVKQVFKGFVLNRNNADQLLWLMFNPPTVYQSYFFHFRIGDTWVKGNFGIVSFEWQNLRFAYLPNVNNYMFIVEKEDNGKINLKRQTEIVLKKLLLKLKENQEEDLNLQSFYSSKREFITTTSVNVHISLDKFKLEENQADWFMMKLREDMEFDGAIEIEKVGTNWNDLYPVALGRAFFRDDLVNKIYHILFQEEHTPVALVGPAGVGKHAIVQEAIWRYQHDLFAQRKTEAELLWHIDPSRIISGMSVVGWWQKRTEAILKYVIQPQEHSKKSDKILIDNPIALLQIGKSAQSNMTLSDVLKPYLEKRLLQLVLIATSEEWKIIQEKAQGFSDLFQVIRLEEPDYQTTAQIVLEQRKLLEYENDCIFTIQAIHQIFYLYRNYFKNQALPGGVVKMLVQLAVKYRGSTIDAPQVREEFQASSGLAEKILAAETQLNDRLVHDALAEQLVGQPHAVRALANVVQLIKAKLVDKGKPVSSFLFIGPTGVGKTQAAKVLCNYLMGSEEYLLRFDMNEFIDESAVQRLIGDFYNPEGLLTGKVRYRPFGILLLDEIEKANPRVHDLLLQLLDEGRLTDSLGRPVDFTNTIIIMTSNLGAQNVSSRLGFNTPNQSDDVIYRKAVENFFRPEFVNRIDQIVIFNPLELDHILNIARLQIKELLQRDGFVRRTTILNISKDALEWVARRGYDARMGGRALKRQIERDLTTLSAEQLISTRIDSPIIFDISFAQDRLVPHISPLDFAFPLQEKWLPQLPDEKHGKSFYGKLLHSLEKIEQRISALEYRNRTSPDIFNWRHYAFKDKIAGLKEGIQNIMLSFRERYQHPTLPLRLKWSSLVPRRDNAVKAVRENFKDRLFQEEALRELSEAYYYGGQQFDSMQTEFLHYYVSTFFLLLSAQDFLESKVERIKLRFDSLITGLGRPEIQYLLGQYTGLLKALDIHFETKEGSNEIVAEGHALSDLFGGEAGIHLFYIAQQNPLPIKIHLQSEKTPPADTNKLEVIRIYYGSTTLTDLRSGFSNTIQMSPSELKLLLYAGIDPSIRKELIIWN